VLGYERNARMAIPSLQKFEKKNIRIIPPSKERAGGPLIVSDDGTSLSF
jgi:hypothetical protein